jgi:hypothetical protein
MLFVQIEKLWINEIVGVIDIIAVTNGRDGNTFEHQSWNSSVVRNPTVLALQI